MSFIARNSSIGRVSYYWYGMILGFLVIIFHAGQIYGQFSELNKTTNPSVEVVRETFLRGPGKDFSTAPLWVWNDLLTEEQIRQSLRDLAGQRVLQAFVHPRPGLMTPYLSDDWFRLWRVALDEAQKLDMNIWIYDENSYPSGFAGGFVPEAMNDSRGKGLALKRVDKLDRLGENVAFVYKKENDQYIDVTEQAKKEGQLSNGTWVLYQFQDAASGPWYGDWFYVDLLKKGVVSKFIEITHERYKKELGQHFGKRIPGIFTDEPHIAPNGQLTWTADLPEVFQAKYSYPLTAVLPLLNDRATVTLSDGRTIDWKEARHHYYQVLLEMFIERWAIPNFEFCEANGLEFTGHYWEHGWPNIQHGPDPMAMYAWHHRPSIDMLMNEWSDSVNAQFGNNRAVRELSSIANQFGRSHTLSETYGAGGWDLRFQDMKRIGDWQYALGVTTTDEHLAYITIRGARKHDHPQSFSRHASWWNDYHVLAEWHTRMSWLVSQGKQKNDLLVIQPTTTAWFWQNEPESNAFGKNFADLIRSLETAQVEYDLGSEELIARFAQVDESGTFQLGKAAWRTVLLPETMENINQKTLVLLDLFVQKGGTLLSFDQVPTRIEGVSVDQCNAQDQEAWKRLFNTRSSAMNVSQQGSYEVEAVSLFDVLDQKRLLFTDGNESHADFIKTMQTNGKVAQQTVSVLQRLEQPMLFHSRRQLVDGEMLFLCNTDLQQEKSGRLYIRSETPQLYLQKAELLNPLLGTVTPLPHRNVMVTDEDVYLATDFTLPPCGSMVLLLTTGSTPAPEFIPPIRQEIVIPAQGKIEVKRLEPNVLVLDYCSLTLGDQIGKEDYFFRVNEELWKAFGFKQNPWRSAVQFRDKLITHQFDEKGDVNGNKGFEVSWRFTINEEATQHLVESKELFAVIEKADQYEIFCNGQSVSHGDRWWMEPVFGEVEISSLIKPGENRLTIRCAAMNMYCEIMPIFLRGDFSLTQADNGFAIDKPHSLPVPGDGQQLGWNQAGLPFYASGVAYRQSFDIATPGSDLIWLVKLPCLGNLEQKDTTAKWNGALARVMVNGKLAGHLFTAPCELEVSSLLHQGVNEIEVIIVGTPKNLFGPHHAGKMRGRAWPQAFSQGPATQPSGSLYDTIPYGLLEPFVLTRR